ncbi:MAG TPA: hypothetical protein VG318_17670 [Actinomycetota bacterium]|nr:hypothetical protein [Actinomycetota bacterium]
MKTKTVRRACAALAALALSASIPATTAGAATSTCNAVTHSTGSEVAVVLEGHYRWPKDNTADVRLTCHIVQNGVKVVSVTDPLSGHVAALVSDARIGTDPFSVCYTIMVSNQPAPWDWLTMTNC